MIWEWLAYLLLLISWNISVISIDESELSVDMALLLLWKLKSTRSCELAMVCWFKRWREVLAI